MITLPGQAEILPDFCEIEARLGWRALFVVLEVPEENVDDGATVRGSDGLAWCLPLQGWNGLVSPIAIVAVLERPHQLGPAGQVLWHARSEGGLDQPGRKRIRLFATSVDQQSATSILEPRAQRVDAFDRVGLSDQRATGVLPCLFGSRGSNGPAMSPGEDPVPPVLRSPSRDR